ncbi:hypothetical protein DFP95_1531, partial [Cohnella lupini]
MVRLLNGLAIFFIIAGVFSGIILGNYGTGGFSWSLAITWWISGMIT